MGSQGEVLAPGWVQLPTGTPAHALSQGAIAVAGGQVGYMFYCVILYVNSLNYYLIPYLNVI